MYLREANVDPAKCAKCELIAHLIPHGRAHSG